nr:hypothetical protein [uncultured Carboxylicivirga sp.]
MNTYQSFSVKLIARRKSKTRDNVNIYMRVVANGVYINKKVPHILIEKYTTCYS